MTNSHHRCCNHGLNYEKHTCSILKHYYVKGSRLNDNLPPDKKYKVCQTLYSRLRYKKVKKPSLPNYQTSTPLPPSLNEYPNDTLLESINLSPPPLIFNDELNESAIKKQRRSTDDVLKKEIN